MKKIAFVSLVFMIVSCKNEANQSKSYAQLQNASWFLGTWENDSKEGYFKEIWTIKNDSTYTAHSFVTVEKDTVFNEYVDLVQRNDSLFYIVSVKRQNNEKPVSFYLSLSSHNHLIFENPKHDFPSKIIYHKIANDSLVSFIEGSKDGKIITESFPMKKI